MARLLPSESLMVRAASPLSRVVQSIRSFWMGPWSARDPEAAWLFGARPVSSGVMVTESTALTYSAVWAAVHLIASHVANLPLMLYRKNGTTGGKEKFDRHPLYRLVHDRPNPEMSSFTFRETLQAHVLLWGNAYAEIERDNADRPLRLWPLTPNRVTPYRDRAGLHYRVANWQGGDTILDPSNMLHVPGLGFDGTCGYSVIHHARESIGLGLAEERFGGSFFGNGASFGGVLSFPGPRPPELAEKSYRDSLNAQHQGVDRAHKFLMVYNGAKYERMGIPPNDAQFLESRTFQVNEICRWFNVPPHKLKELSKATNNNIEQQALEFYTDCLAPWLERWEQELCEKLISPLERTQQEIEFVITGLLRGDIASRGEFYAKRFTAASVTPNDIRKLENENPLPGGDIAAWPLTHIPLNLAEKYFQAQIDKLTAPPPAPATVDPDPAALKRIEALSEELRIVRAIASEAEAAKDAAIAEKLTALGQLEAERAAHAAASQAKDAEIHRLIGATEALSLDLATAQRDRDTGLQALTIDRDQLARRIQAFETEVAALTQEVDATVTNLTHERTNLAEAEQALAHAQQDVAQLRAERETLLTHLATAQAVSQDVLGQMTDLRTHLAGVETELLEARTALAKSETREADTETARKVFEDLAAQRSADVDRLQRRLVDVSGAVRHVVLDRLTWLVEHEADRARAKQGSPEKLRKWIDDFYSADFAERCRTILRPSVRAWMLCVQHPEPVEHLLDILVSQYVEQSVRQLRNLASEETVDTLAPALEKLLRRWEASRAESLADRVLREAA